MMLNAGNYDVPQGHVVAIVTYLEMTAPATIADRSFPDGVTVSQERMDNDSYRRLFRAIGEPWLWTSRLTLADDALTAILSEPHTETWVVRKAGPPIALIELDFSSEGVCELAFFGMIGSAIGHGLGSAMMAFTQSRAFRDNVTLFTVHTCSLDDPRALGFYRNAGFTPIRRSVEIFADPRLDGSHDLTTASHIPCLP